MLLNVKGRHVEVSDSVRDYAEEKFGKLKLQRQLPDPTTVEIELSLEHNPAIADDHIAEATVWTKGPTLRVRECAPSHEAALDQLATKLERQVKRYNEKRSRKGTARRANGHAVPEEPNFTAEQLDTMIVKSKQFDLQPLSAEEAVLELELVGHDFFVFLNEETQRVEVVYRRRDGGYGHIEPSAGPS